ncbi:MAG: hypothetical protein JSR11_03875 [Bacteroidetes bacterium]|nr:hypothetical protein [Bacteroidota bacterium]
MDTPNISDKLFLEVDTSTSYSYASINRSKGHLNELGLFYIIEGYREATNLLLEKIGEPEKDWLKVDSLIYPLLFNFRHYLEVIIKDTLRYYRLYKREIFSNETGFVKEHSLTKLWQELEPYLKECYSHVDKIETDLKAVENLLIEFDSVDKGSYTFRYSFEGSKKNNTDIVYSIGSLTINLENIHNTIRKMQNFFEGINLHIAALLDESISLRND